MAERISICTGISADWLLANNCRVPPSRQGNRRERYRKQTYEFIVAESSAPRVNLADLFFYDHFLADAYHRLGAMLLNAYRRDEMPYYLYKIRTALQKLEQEIGPAVDLLRSDVASPRLS